MTAASLVKTTGGSVRFPDVLQILSEETGLLKSDIKRIISSASVSYKTYTIPKRSGGERIISQPSRPVKIIQRAFSKRILSELPLHSSAMAYRRGKSILDNAKPHQGVGRAILKIDFEDFFSSIRSLDWVNYCRYHKLFTEEDCHLTSKLLFKKEDRLWGLRLAIGAPSSPLISNILMYDFDEMVSRLIVSDNVVYTRYADDLTFSAPRTGYLVNVEKQVRRILKAISYPRLKINNNKTVRVTAKYRRSVTGIILTNDGKTSVGRDKKRIVSSGVHHATQGKLNRDELKRLSGHISYINAVEHDFLLFLEKKYGRDIICSLKKLGNPKSK